MGGNTENINNALLNPWKFRCKTKEKISIKTYEQKAILPNISLYNRQIPLTWIIGWVSIHCELKMDEQDLQAG